jgi:ABC-type multidrug transport system ATPase subunit
LLLVLDDGERHLPEQDPHYLWMDAGLLRLSSNPPNRNACLGHFVSELGDWWFHAGPGTCPPELRLNGRAVTEPDVRLTSLRAEVRLSGEPYTAPTPRRPAKPEPRVFNDGPAYPAAGPTDPVAQLVVGPPGTDAQIVIDEPSVRPDHARIEVDSRGSWWITARNGEVFADGQAVSVVRRDPGSRVAFGRAVVTIPDQRRQRRALGVHLAEVTVRSGARRLLDKVSLSLPPGELVAVVSPDEVGAQALLGLVAGGYRPNGGTMRIGGSTRRRDHRVRWVPATDDLHGTLTVRETLSLTAENAPAALLDEIVSWVGLDGKADAWVQRLSVAELRRLSIGVELVARPALLVVLGAGSAHDIDRDRDLISRLRTISRDLSCTVLFAAGGTANIDLCDTVVVLDRRGRVQYTGPPARAEQIVGLDGPGAAGQASLPSHLPPWAPVVEPEAPLARLGVVVRAEALMIRRRGNGATALVLVTFPAMGVVALSRERPLPYLAVAVVAGLIVGRFDLCAERARLVRGREHGISFGAAVAGKLAVYGAACAALAVPLGGLAALRAPAVELLPGASAWLSGSMLFWLTMVAAIGVGMLGSALARAMRAAVALTALFALLLTGVSAALAGWSWAAWTLGLALITAGAACTAVAVLENRRP